MTANEIVVAMANRNLVLKGKKLAMLKAMLSLAGWVPRTRLVADASAKSALDAASVNKRVGEMIDSGELVRMTLNGTDWVAETPGGDPSIAYS